ncbi:MAG: hypothetical protein K6B14_07750 [Lachnospiraceae bacterium]|nr:hypothetical protein [Lachnospiraceae bacterium]
MTSKYIFSEMEPSSSGLGGSFEVLASFTVDIIPAPFNDVSVKIDTGCSISTVPLGAFRVLRLFCDGLKKSDIRNGVPYQLSYGVESAGMRHKKPNTDAEKMNCPAIKFQHDITGFSIAGVPIHDDKIFVNYDRRGNILIGMDIISKWDVHMSISKDSGKYVFLGCPLDSINDEYRDALARHFGIDM